MKSKITENIQGEKIFTLFGSSRLSSDSHLPFIDYLDEYSKGNVLLTGGYNGTMSCFSKRFKLNKGTSIGITAKTIVDTIPENSYSKIISLNNPIDRLVNLITLPNIIIILPGGIGTMVELNTSIWYIDRGFIESKKIILLGKQWEEWLSWFKDCEYQLINKNITNFVKVVKTIEDFDREMANYNQF